jgi:hypothetical protein
MTKANMQAIPPINKKPIFIYFLLSTNPHQATSFIITLSWKKEVLIPPFLTFVRPLVKVGGHSVKDLGSRETLEIVQRYTRSITFNDALKFYNVALR